MTRVIVLRYAAYRNGKTTEDRICRCVLSHHSSGSGKKKERDIPALWELTKISLEAIIKTVEQECRDRQDIIRKAVIYISHCYNGCRCSYGSQFVKSVHLTLTA